MLDGAFKSAWIEMWGGFPEGPWLLGQCRDPPSDPHSRKVDVGPPRQDMQRGWGARAERCWFSPFS